MRILAAVALLTLAASLASAASLTPTQLRCENLTDPLGIDAAHPRLSWVLQATPPSQRGQAQTGYQILVASDASLLAHDRGDLWDSGKVASDQSTHVAYAGRPLASYARCYWKVRAWDRAGKPSSWSAPALFTIGVLRPEDWQARWITYNQPAGETIPLGDEGKSLDFTGAQWIWYPEGDPHTEVPGGSRYFRHALDVPADKPVATAQMLFTVDDYWILYVNGQEIARSKPGAEQWRQAPQVDLAKFLIAGRNVIAVEGINAAPSPAGFVGKLLVRFADGAEQKLVTDASWKAAKSKEPGWETVKFDASAWAQAMDLGAMGAGPWGAIQTGGTAAWAENRSSPILRKTFRVAKTLREATVSVCGLGFYELRLNGAKVGDRTLDTPFTRYDKRALYATYDITSLLKPGDNALGVMLGNGWYNQFSRDAWDFQNARWRDRPKLLLQVRLVFADGTTRIIGSDSTWQGNTGPVIRDDVRNGEVYDARRELPGWDTAAYDASKWPAAQPAAAPKGVLRAETMPPVRVMATLTPVSLKQTKPGVWVFDMGQAFAGRDVRPPNPGWKDEGRRRRERASGFEEAPAADLAGRFHPSAMLRLILRRAMGQRQTHLSPRPARRFGAGFSCEQRRKAT